MRPVAGSGAVGLTELQYKNNARESKNARNPADIINCHFPSHNFIETPDASIGLHNGREKLVEVPKVVGQPGHHGGGRTELAGAARLAGPPDVIIMRREHGESRL